MGNPITPAALKNFVPSVTAKVCEALTKAMLGFPAAIFRWYGWAWNADATASNALKQSIVPSGFIMANAGSNLTVTDWLVCNGQSVSKETYPELYAAIGTIYGGNGAPNFMVPNLVDKFIIGVGENNLAATGGEKQVTLTAATTGPHTHGVTQDTPIDTPLYFGGYDEHETGDGGPVINPSGVINPPNKFGFTIDSGGGGEPHENRPPFLALNWFIKT